MKRVKAVKDARRARPPKEAIKVVHARREKEAFAAVDAAIAMINMKKKKKQVEPQTFTHSLLPCMHACRFDGVDVVTLIGILDDLFDSK
jgi:hypothetical protein